MEELIVKEAKAALEVAKPLTEKYGEYRIVTADQYLISAEDLQIVKGKWKEIEAKRTAITEPINKGLKEINALFKTPLDLLAGLESQIKKEINAFAYRQAEAKRIEEQKLLERAAKAEAKGKEEKAETLKMQATAVALADTTPKVSGVSFTERWGYRITDEAKVPRAFLMVDTSKLQKYAVATKGTMPVDGVEFYSERNINSRSK